MILDVGEPANAVAERDPDDAYLDLIEQASREALLGVGDAARPDDPLVGSFPIRASATGQARRAAGFAARSAASSAPRRQLGSGCQAITPGLV